MTSKEIQASIDKWLSRTHVFVGFHDYYVELEGHFLPDELSEIAGIQRKRLRELQPVRESQQKGLFDG
jgi:hypothetical protein